MELRITAEVLGIEAFESDLEQSLSDAVRKTATQIRTEIETSLERGGHSGRQYKRSGRIHVASAPGEVPARDSGDLWGSISQVETNGLVSQFEIRSDHAWYLEEGTENIAARPFIEPAVDLVIEQSTFEL